MAFSDTVKAQALARANGRCECSRVNHSHAGRCSTRLVSGNYQFNHKHAQSLGGHDGLSNCEVLCIPCHKGTASYGRH